MDPPHIQAGLVLRRRLIRQGAIQLANEWVRVRTNRQVDIDRELWIALVKYYESLLMRNRPELININIGDDYQTPAF